MRIQRTRLASAVTGPLYFAQTRDDIALEMEALAPRRGEKFVTISSSGCLPLSLISAGAEVVGVDLNATQNHLVELKLTALSSLSRAHAFGFLGYTAAPGAERRQAYALLAERLSPSAREYWNRRARQIARGVIRSGVTERFLSVLAWLVRHAVQGPRRVQRLLGCRSLEEQRDFYAREWNRWPWRALFFAAANRLSFRRVYHPAFFRHVENPSFARHFLRVWERTLTRLPVADNFYLHQLFTGYLPADRPQALFHYLTEPGLQSLLAERARLSLVDGSLLEYLRSCPPASIHGFSLSNICEWLDTEQTHELFEAMARAAAPGARLCFRNFLGWTEVPEKFRSVFTEDVARGEALIERDRSLVQRRFALCHFRAPGSPASRLASPAAEPMH